MEQLLKKWFNFWYNIIPKTKKGLIISLLIIVLLHLLISSVLLFIVPFPLGQISFLIFVMMELYPLGISILQLAEIRKNEKRNLER